MQGFHITFPTAFIIIIVKSEDHKLWLANWGSPFHAVVLTRQCDTYREDGFPLEKNSPPPGIHSIMLSPLGCHICIIWELKEPGTWKIFFSLWNNPKGSFSCKGTIDNPSQHYTFVKQPGQLANGDPAHFFGNLKYISKEKWDRFIVAQQILTQNDIWITATEYWCNMPLHLGNRASSKAINVIKQMK